MELPVGPMAPREVRRKDLLDPAAVQRLTAVGHAVGRRVALLRGEKPHDAVAKLLVVRNEPAERPRHIARRRRPSLCDALLPERDGGVGESVLRAEVPEQRALAHPGQLRDALEGRRQLPFIAKETNGDLEDRLAGLRSLVRSSDLRVGALHFHVTNSDTNVASVKTRRSSVFARRLHGGRDELTALHPGDVLKDDRKCALDVVLHGPSDVGRHKQVGRGPKGALWRQRLLRKDIEGRASQTVFTEGLHQGYLVDDAAPRHVDEHRIGPEAPKGAFIEEAARLAGEWNREDEVVSPWQERTERRDAVNLDDTVGGRSIVAWPSRHPNDQHAKGRSRGGDGAPHFTESDEHESTPSQRAGSERLPSRRRLLREEPWQLTFERQEHGKHVITHGVPVNAARVGDDNVGGESARRKEAVDTSTEKVNKAKTRRGRPIGPRRTPADEDLKLRQRRGERRRVDDGALRGANVRHHQVVEEDELAPGGTGEATQRFTRGLRALVGWHEDVQSLRAPCHSSRMYQAPAASVLARRSSLGLELRRTGESAVVVRVTQGGTAAALGIAAGDRIVALGGEPVRSSTHLVALTRACELGSHLHISVVRGAERLELAGPLLAAPVEQILGAELHLGHVTVGGHRLRTLRTAPTLVANAPVVLMLPGLGSGSCELSSDDNDPQRHLLVGLTRLGLATLRVERSGTGDSEGPPARERGFFDELAGWRAALDGLREEGVPVYLFGQSVGGMMAPLLAGESDGVTGVVVWGTSAQRWCDCITQAMVRQRRLRGAPDESEVAAWTELYRRVFREGATPADVFASAPALGGLEGSSCHGATMFGRHVSFFQELERLDLQRLWSTITAPLLVLHGALDWVCTPEEGRAVAQAAGALGRFVELPQLGHDLLRHDNLHQSFHEPGSGVWDGTVLTALEAWLETLP